MGTSHLAKQPRNLRPMDQSTRDYFIRATIDPLRRDFSSGLLTSVAGVYMPPALVLWFQNVARLLG